MFRTRKSRTAVDLSGLTELRVHGVGGSAPEQFLDVPYTDFVAGDLTAGFFAAPDQPDLDPPRRLEAYSWGGLTSRSRIRALWLLLLPFALVNLAGWMADRGRTAAEAVASGRDDGAGREVPMASRLSVASLRIAGLVTTATAMLFVAVAGIDLFGYQCGSNACADPGRWINWPLTTEWAAEGLGRRLLIGSALPFIVAAVVAFITKRSQEFIHPDVSMEPGGSIPLDPVHTMGLADRGFWRSPHVAHRLGIAHTAAAFAVTGHVLASTEVAIPGMGIDDWWRLLFVGLLFACGIAVLAVGRLRARWYWGLLLVTLASLAVLVLLSLGADAAAPAGQPAGARRLAIPLFWAAVVSIAVFAAAQLGAVTGGPGPLHRRLFNGFAPIALAVIGVGVVISVGSGVLIQIANLLGDGMPFAQWSAEGGTADAIVYTDLAGAAAVVTVATLIVMVVVTMVMAAWAWGRRDRSASVAAVYTAAGRDIDPDDPRIHKVLREVGLARAVASLTDRVAAILGIGILATLVMVAWAVIDAGGDVGVADGFGASLQGRASTVLALLPLVGIFVINRSSRSVGVRRGIGILWDVATFWPRWFHPFAPPSYGERAVPQLAYRIGAILDAGGRVILSAHSQGSVVGAAAIVALQARREGGVAGVTFLTHGSPLGRLYARFFRAYFDDGLLRRIAGAVSVGGRPGWRNLHRRTDFIGGPVFTIEVPGYVDIEVLDPPDIQLVAGEPLPKPQRHFNYTDDPDYEAALRDLV